MSWAKVDDGLYDHPKVDAMLEADELCGAAALGLWVAALSYCARQLTDGEVTRRAVQRLFPDNGLKLAAVFVEHGLWDATDNGWTIRGYLDCNRTREDLLAHRRADADRKAADRARRLSNRTSDRTSSETSRETSERRPSGRPDPPSRPVPSRPDPSRPDLEVDSPDVAGRAPRTNED